MRKTTLEGKITIFKQVKIKQSTLRNDYKDRGRGGGGGGGGGEFKECGYRT